MERSKLLHSVILVWLLSALHLSAQDHRFMVFFQDKNSSFNIENPADFLSVRAIERRAKQNIAITEQDLPISQDYITALEGEGAKVWFVTKWLNGALIQADSSILTNISALPFVSLIEFVAPGELKAQNVIGLQLKNQSITQGRAQSTEIQNTLLGIDQMQQEGITGEGMLIAVLDGGFMGVNQTQPFEHLIANNQLVTTFDYVGNSTDVFRYADHGTKVLSVIAAISSGVFTGSAINAEYILCVTEDVSSEYRVEEYNWLFAAELSDSAGVDIINTSLGYSIFDDPNMNYTVEDLEGSISVISNAASIAASKGMVLIVSAGNAGNSSWQSITAPADAHDILSVGAITEDSIKASFSSTGPSADGRIKPDVVALGVKTAVINRNGNMVFNNGTSFSAPQIAGLAAGVWQSNPEFNYLQVIESIKNSGHLAQSPDNQTGHGIPHYLRAKKLVLSVDEPLTKGFFKLYPNPLDSRLYMLSEIPLPTATFFMHNISGQKILENQLFNIPASVAIPVDLPLLPSGIYLVTVLSTDHASTFRLIKE